MIPLDEFIGVADNLFIKGLWHIAPFWEAVHPCILYSQTCTNMTLYDVNELHRHTEFSSDHSSDGTVLDAMGLPPPDVVKKSPSLNKTNINPIALQFIGVS